MSPAFGRLMANGLLVPNLLHLRGEYILPGIGCTPHCCMMLGAAHDKHQGQCCGMQSLVRCSCMLLLVESTRQLMPRSCRGFVSL